MRKKILRVQFGRRRTCMHAVVALLCCVLPCCGGNVGTRNCTDCILVSDPLLPQILELAEGSGVPFVAGGDLTPAQLASMRSGGKGEVRSVAEGLLRGLNQSDASLGLNVYLGVRHGVFHLLVMRNGRWGKAGIMIDLESKQYAFWSLSQT